MALLGILFVALVAFAMRLDRRKHVDIGGFAVVDVLMIGAIVSLAVAGVFMLGGTVLTL